jgi:hypothetical protein
LTSGSGELSVALVRGGDPLDPACERPNEAPPIPEAAERHRFAAPDGAPELTLSPALPDRAVVVRPDLPLHVPAGMETTLSVSVPAWFRVEVAGLATPVLDWPVHRPSDTWFGPSVREGELCYASRTRARLSTPTEPGMPARVRCRLRLRNDASDELLVERISLPIPRLALFADAAGTLHAGSVQVARQPGGTSVEVTIDRGPPEGLEDPTPLGERRVSDHHNMFVRALGALLG